MQNKVNNSRKRTKIMKGFLHDAFFVLFMKRKNQKDNKCVSPLLSIFLNLLKSELFYRRLQNKINYSYKTHVFRTIIYGEIDLEEF